MSVGTEFDQDQKEGDCYMPIVLPLDHKQIAYVSYDPDEKCLVVVFHRGEVRRHEDIDQARFFDLLDSMNKVDTLCSLVASHSK